MGCEQSKTISDIDVPATITTVLEEPRAKSRRKHCHRNGHRRRREKKVSTPSARTTNVGVDQRITAKYDVKALIGKGDFSRVFRVEHRASKQPYALKIIEVDASYGPATFRAELSVLCRVNHPNIVSLVESFEDSENVYIVMELATGGSLLDKMDVLQRPFAESEASAALKMVLSGVAYLHELGITHRALRPDTLLYSHPGANSKIVITDFGIASTRRQNGFMHTVCGVLQYMAPEIAARRSYTCAVDLWAVGVIAFILLSATLPFDAKQDAQLLKFIIKGEFSMEDKVWREVSGEAKDFIRCLLQRDPARRMSASHALRHPWISGRTSKRLPLGSRPSNSPPCSDSNSGTSLRSRASSSGHSSRQSVKSYISSRERRLCGSQLAELHKDPELSELVQQSNSLDPGG